MGSCVRKEAKKNISDISIETNSPILTPTCNICSEGIETSRKMYGILPGCKHAFCYGCIAKWYSRGYVGRNCPVCQRCIITIIPTPVYFRHNSVNKQRLLLNHVRKSNCEKQKLPNGLTVEQYIKFIVCPIKTEEDENEHEKLRKMLS